MGKPSPLAEVFGTSTPPAGRAAPVPSDQDGPGLPPEPCEPYDDGPPTERYDTPDDLYQTAPTPVADTDETDPLDVVAPPRLADGALQGRAGRIVRALAPHTEADPAALLLTLLAWFGVMADRGPHVQVSNEEHPARLWPLIVGRTSGGAKGTSLSVVRRLMRAVDPQFGANISTGLTSGEGLIEYLRDPSEDLDPDAAGFNEGRADKRLLVIETEFAAVLARGRRESSTLLQVLRNAWDGEDLQTMSRKKNSLSATDHHVSVIGHISPAELLRSLRDADLAGGTLNRFLLAYSTRSKRLPEGGNVPADVLDQLATEVSAALSVARTRRRFHRDTAAAALWGELYDELTADRPDDWFSAAVARGVTQVLRLSLTYALLDGADTISADHLTAAYELWLYCEDTARWLFTSDKDAAAARERARLTEFIAGGGSEGVTRTEIRDRLYQRHKSAAAITALLQPLVKEGRVRETKIPGRGRPTTRYTIS